MHSANISLKSSYWLGPSQSCNLGNGTGFSVQEVIDVAKKVNQRDIQLVDAPRREGDLDRLIAKSSLIRRDLNWQPLYPYLFSLIQQPLY